VADVNYMLVDGVRIAYARYGRSTAPPLVLLHALGEGRHDWSGLLDRFVDEFDVVTVDLRGHGDSDWPDTYSSELMATDIVGLLDALDLHAVTLLGHSLGGVVAYLVAERRPDLVGRLIIEDAPPPVPRDRPVPERPDSPLPFDWAVLLAIIEETRHGNPAAWERLKTIAAPTLLIGGGPQSHIPQDSLLQVARLIPDCDLVTIPAGHHIHRALPFDFIEVVLDWCGGRPVADVTK
jgi:3-oxoadipate enol-lactonase